MKKRKSLDERLLMGDVYKEVMEEAYIGREIVVENVKRTRDDGMPYRRVKIDGFYPNFVLAIDEDGLHECFSYYDVWKTMYKHI